MDEFILENKQQLLREENKYIEQHRENPLCLNKRSAYSGFDDHKEYNKHYYERNRETQLVKKKEYKENNIEYFREYDRVRSQRPERKEQHNTSLSRKIMCVCGLEMRADSRRKHEKSKRHIEFINSQHNQ